MSATIEMSTQGPADDYLLINSLASVLRMCVGKVTTVELRNEAYVTGRVVAVDGYMNVTMRDAKVVDAARNACDFEHYFVQNRLVRFVQLPVEINIKKELERMFDPEVKEAARQNRGRRDVGLKVSGGRRKIEAERQKRRAEDLKNALAMKEEMLKGSRSKNQP